MKHLIYIILFICICMFSSCGTTKYIEKEVPIETIKTIYKDSLRFDSIYMHDSVSVYIKGDTVFKDKIRIKYKYKNVAKNTIITDTIEKPVYIRVTKEVNKTSFIQNILIKFGAVSLVFLIVFLALRFKKL